MRFALVLVAAVLVLAVAVADDGPRREPSGRLVSGLALGVTHTQYDIGSGSDPAAGRRAREVLGSTVLVQAQDVMGWGALNPEPTPGVHAWATLDARVALLESTGSVPVLVLCGAPDWMKGGAEGQTDWSQLEVAPTREHYDDFARLAVAIANRYPQVRHFVVWNELKGFHDEQSNTWNAASYTDMYNTVYTALKAHDPGLAVGGPYVPMDSWSDQATMSHPSHVAGPWGVVDSRALSAVETWLAGARGADFVVVDGTTETRDAGLVTDPVTATAKFSAIDSWLRQRTSLPVWWAEFYAPGGDPVATDAAERHAAAQAAALVRMAADGVAVALSWQPQAEGDSCEGCLWSDTRSAAGGTATPSATAFAQLRDVLAAAGTGPHRVVDSPAGGLTATLGRHRVTVTSSPPRVTVEDLG